MSFALTGNASSINLNRDVAAQRSALVTVDSYDIALDLTTGDTHFHSVTTVEFSCQRPGANTFIDLRGAHLHKATLNGEELDVEAYNTALSNAGETGENGLPLPHLNSHNTLVVDADCRYSTTGEGLHRAVDAADNKVYLYSQCEPADGKRVFACFDQPDMKAPIALTVTAPTEWEVMSNTEIASSESREDGSVTHHFTTSKPLPPYLFAICAGPYHRWEDTYRGTDPAGGECEIPLRLYCRETLANYFDPETIFELTKGGFDYYHRTFGIRYPFNGTYDQVFVPDFNAGAMENAGCVTYREDYVFRSRATAWKYERRADTVLHEMAHMWFGDLVTMRWWDDLWLNESFASWASVMAQLGSTSYQNAWTTFASREKNWAYRQDDLPSTHPIANSMQDLTELDANFDGITYAKGCSVLKQLVAYAGLDNFLNGLHDYLETHSYGNATFDDLLTAISQYSPADKDLRQWADAWLTTTGRNTIAVAPSLQKDGTYGSLTVTQSGAQPGAGELRPHHLGVGIYQLTSDGVKSALRLARYTEVDITGASTTVDELVGQPKGNLVLPNDEDLTYCAIELDDASVRTVLRYVEAIENPLSRTLCWTVLEEMAVHATLPGRDLVEVMCRALPLESQLPVAEHLMNRGVQLLNFFTDPQWARETGWVQFSTMLWDLVCQPHYGVDQQLIALNTFCRCALQPDQRQFLRRLLEEGCESMGITELELDTDLRWTVLTALAAHGDATEDEIDSMLASDNTSMGIRRALTAKAAIPTRANKERVWSDLTTVGDEALSNWSIAALLDGLFWSGQESIVQSIAASYEADIVDLWNKRGGEVAAAVTEGAFPRWAGVRTVAALVNALLEKGDELPSGLRRLLNEGLADVRRAAAARQCDKSDQELGETE